MPDQVTDGPTNEWIAQRLGDFKACRSPREIRAAASMIAEATADLRAALAAAERTRDEVLRSNDELSRIAHEGYEAAVSDYRARFYQAQDALVDAERRAEEAERRERDQRTRAEGHAVRAGAHEMRAARLAEQKERLTAALTRYRHSHRENLNCAVSTQGVDFRCEYCVSADALLTSSGESEVPDALRAGGPDHPQLDERYVIARAEQVRQREAVVQALAELLAAVEADYDDDYEWDKQFEAALAKGRAAARGGNDA